MSRRVRWVWIGLGVLVGVGVWVGSGVPSAPEVARLQRQRPEKTALMQWRESRARKEGKKYRVWQRWVPRRHIPEVLRRAVIVAEDGAFYQHEGIDWFEVRESLERNLEEMEIKRGASTLTQQLAKNLYLSPRRTPIRKLREIFITWRLENNLSKDRILELYLNVIEWGPGIFGIGAAAQAYFGKVPAALTTDECIRLAAAIPSPLKTTPKSNRGALMRRMSAIQARLAARGW